MAIRLIDQYPNRAGVPNADYPHGVPRNKSTPTSTDGTPFEQAWFRDKEGFFQGLLETAGITPSGSPDTVEQSDYFDALVGAMHGVTEVDVGGVGDVTLGIYPSRVAALRLTGILGADVDLVVPDTERLYWIIDETTGGFSVTVRTSAGTGVEVSADTSVLRSNGTDVVGALDYATEAEAQALTSLSKLLTPGRLGDAMNAHVLGMGQTWQDVASSRAAETTYTNTTGRPIAVSILAGVSGSPGNSINLVVGDEGVYSSPAYSTTSVCSLNNVVIPGGATYRLNAGGLSTVDSIRFWKELR